MSQSAVPGVVFAKRRVVCVLSVLSSGPGLSRTPEHPASTLLVFSTSSSYHSSSTSISSDQASEPSNSGRLLRRFGEGWSTLLHPLWDQTMELFRTYAPDPSVKLALIIKSRSFLY